jgi:hypothetical protein
MLISGDAGGWIRKIQCRDAHCAPLQGVIVAGKWQEDIYYAVPKGEVLL